MTADSTGRSLFIVDNSVSGWMGLRYLEEWSGIAKAFDIATMSTSTPAGDQLLLTVLSINSSPSTLKKRSPEAIGDVSGIELDREHLGIRPARWTR